MFGKLKLPHGRLRTRSGHVATSYAIYSETSYSLSPRVSRTHVGRNSSILATLVPDAYTDSQSDILKSGPPFFWDTGASPCLGALLSVIAKAWMLEDYATPEAHKEHAIGMYETPPGHGRVLGPPCTSSVSKDSSLEVIAVTEQKCLKVGDRSSRRHLFGGRFDVGNIA